MVAMRKDLLQFRHRFMERTPVHQFDLRQRILIYSGVTQSRFMGCGRTMWLMSCELTTFFLFLSYKYTLKFVSTLLTEW